MTQFEEKYTPEQFMSVFENDYKMHTTGHIIKEVGCDRKTAMKYLTKLEREDHIAREYYDAETNFLWKRAETYYFSFGEIKQYVPQSETKDSAHVILKQMYTTQKFIVCNIYMAGAGTPAFAMAVVPKEVAKRWNAEAKEPLEDTEKLARFNSVKSYMTAGYIVIPDTQMVKLEVQEAMPNRMLSVKVYMVSEKAEAQVGAATIPFAIWEHIENTE